MFPHQKREPVFVPYWVMKQVRRNDLRANVILDLKKLKEVCSIEDIALTYLLNNSLKYGSCLTGVEYISNELNAYWSEFSLAQLTSIQDVLSLYDGRLEERLFASNGEAAVSAGAELAGKAFEVFEMESGLDTNGVIFLVINSGYFGGAPAVEARKQLVRAYLKQSYVFCDYDDVAKDKLFAQYIRDLT